MEANEHGVIYEEGEPALAEEFLFPAIEYLCQDVPKDASSCLETLKRLRSLGLFHKDDITKHHLLTSAIILDPDFLRKREEREHSLEQVHKYISSRTVDGVIFNYLVEWDPDALKSGSDQKDGKPTVLQYGLTLQFVLRACLKYFPQELVGLLLDQRNDFASPMEVCFKVDREAWQTVEGCLDEVQDLKLHDPDPETGLIPVMTAAADQSCSRVDLVYYLIKRDPGAILGYYGKSNNLETAGTAMNKKRKWV